MQKRDGLTKGLAIGGTVLIWLPIVLPLVFAVLLFSRTRLVRVDYLMPGELFPVVAVGAVLLLWAAVRARSQRKLIAWAAGIGAAALVISQVVAIATGLASGAVEPAGLPLALVMAVYAVYPLAVIVIGVGGVMLARDLFKATPPAGASS